MKSVLKFFSGQKALPAGPAGRVLYAIGDIHGCLNELEDVLQVIDRDINLHGVEDVTIVFLGDLIDRGPDSAGVVRRIYQLSEHQREGVRIVLLAGNHEEALIRAADGDSETAANWIQFGGAEALQSYGSTQKDFDHVDGEIIVDMVRGLVPGRHIDFLRNAKDMALFGDFVLVHAGVDPEIPLTDQTRRSLLWIREPFLSHPRPVAPPYCIVHGHTIVPEVEHRGVRIAIDTGVYESGNLSCLRVEGTDLRRYSTATDMVAFEPLLRLQAAS